MKTGPVETAVVDNYLASLGVAVFDERLAVFALVVETAVLD